ncbi:MAG: ArsA family ATPase [Candidatus Desulfofervidus sp.]|nr:ArsA family ATPase [Candidatus Desulfofervidus sp.]
MRVILFSGKGGVGKTTLAAATGIKIAKRGKRTLVMSLDPAHSLSDAFDLKHGLMERNKGKPLKITENLYIQELDVHEELKKHWGEIHKYLSLLLNVSGFEEVLAEELAILPGMEEVSALLYLNHYYRQKTYDVIILDCAPTGESIRFASIPTALEWYMKKIFKLERRVVRYMRPFTKRLSDIPLPEEPYFDAIEKLFQRLEGVDRLLTNPEVTTVRLVTNPERMVIKETQRAYLYFNLYQICTDAVIINRIIPENIEESFISSLQKWQREYIRLAENYFSPIPIFHVFLSCNEMVGYEKLSHLAETVYAEKNPALIFYQQKPYEFLKENNQYMLRLYLPFITKGEIELTKSNGELIVRIGSFKRHILLPRSFALAHPERAKIKDKVLTINFKGGENG